MSAEPARPRRGLAWPLVLVGAIVLAVIVIVVLRPGPDGSAGPPDTVAGDTPDAALRVTEARPLAGTNLVRIDIGTGGYSGGSFSSSGSGIEQRNILLLDRTSGAARRLLPDNGRTITQAWFLPAQANHAAASPDRAMPAAEDEPPPAYFALLVAQAGHRDRLDLLVGTLAAPEQRFVMQGIDGVDAVWMQSTTRIGLLVRERATLFYRVVDVPTLRVVQQHRVAI